ncbi:hypothetical protein TruAng_005338 [Truncatella angustata]|nr:hypothetical protein TruAng_005338 [Truncatella angustata]
MVEELLDRKANINAGQEEKEDTPLHLAAEEGHVGVMKKLILRGASLNAYSQYSGLVIHSAISSGNFDAVELLVHHGVSLSIDHDNLETPLEQAASLSDMSMLEYLMENENDYQSALDEAAGEGNWEITKVLLEKRANLSCDNIFYKAATTTDDLEVLEALWEYTNGNISADTIDQSLYNTTDNKKTDTVQLLLMKFGADANAQGDDYGNALTASAYDGTLDILKLLLDHGATVNSDDGWALQTAATEGHVDVVKELLSRDANVNARTSNPGFPQQTALQGACELGRAEIVDILLEHGADPNLGGGEDAYPIITAARNGQAEIIAVARKVASLEPLQQLLDAGAEIDATDNNGDTALIAAASVNDDEFVNFLLAKGADVMHKNKDGLNAMQVAYDTDNTGETLSVLINHVSIILSGVKKAIQTGNRAIISVANDARAAAREANNNDIKGDGSQAGSDYPTDADATSSRSKSEKVEFEDLLAEHDSKSYPENRFLKDTDSSQKNDELSHAEVMSNTQDIRREGKDSEMDVDHGTQLEPADQTYTIQNLEYSDIKASSKFSSSSVLQHHPVHIDLHTGPTGGPGYPDTAAATEPGMQNGTDQSVHHNPSQRLNTWHQQPGTDYNIHHGPSYEKYQQVNETSQILAVMPQLDREAPVRRKPAPTAYIGVHHSQDLANINNTISQAVNPSEHRPSSFAAYNPETRQPVSKSSSQTSSSQAQVFGQYQSAHRPPGIQQSFEPGSLTVPHTQSQARDRPVEDHHYGEGLRSSSNQMHRGNHIVHHIPGHPTQTHNSFSQQKNEYPPRPQPIQAYSAPPQLQQQQQQIRSGNDTYYAMPPDSRYPISSSSQLYQNGNISEQTQYEWPDQPKSRTPSFFGVKNTFNQARGKLFSTNKSDDSGR